jgi:hypothetical protein
MCTMRSAAPRSRGRPQSTHGPSRSHADVHYARRVPMAAATVGSTLPAVADGGGAGSRVGRGFTFEDADDGVEQEADRSQSNEYAGGDEHVRVVTAVWITNDDRSTRWRARKQTSPSPPPLGPRRTCSCLSWRKQSRHDRGRPPWVIGVLLLVGSPRQLSRGVADALIGSRA